MFGGVWGWGTDEQLLLQTLEGIDHGSMADLAVEYARQTQGRDLFEDVSSELRGPERQRAQALMTTVVARTGARLFAADVFDAASLKRELETAAPRFERLASFFASQTTAQLDEIRRQYSKQFGLGLDDDIFEAGTWRTSLRGARGFEMRQALQGAPASPAQALERLTQRVAFELDGPANRLSELVFGWLGSERFVLVDAAIARLEAQTALHSASPSRPVDDAEQAVLRADVEAALSELRAARDSAQDVSIALGAGVAAAAALALTGGTATPLVAAGLAASSGAAGALAASATLSGAGHSVRDGAQAALRGGALGLGGALVAPVATANIARGIVVDGVVAGLGSVVAGGGDRWAQRGAAATWRQLGGETLLDFGGGLLIGSVASALFRGATFFVQKRLMKEAQAGQGLGSGPPTVELISDSHGYASDLAAQLEAPRAQRLFHLGDAVNKGAQGGGSRAALRILSAQSSQRPVVRLLGNHELNLAAAFQPGDGPAKLNALRGLLRETTNLVASTLAPFGVGGFTELGRFARHRLAQRLKVSAPQLSELIRSLEAQAYRPVTKVTGVDGLVSGADRLLLSALTFVKDDASFGALALFAGRAQASDVYAFEKAWRAAGLDARQLQPQLDGLRALEETLRAHVAHARLFQVDAQSGALFVHAGLPFEVVEGRTVLRPEHILHAQVLLERGDYLALVQPELLHLNPAFAAGSLTIDPSSGVATQLEGLAHGAHHRQDVTPQMVDEALASFSEALRHSPRQLEAMGLEEFEGVHFIVTGHDSPINDWPVSRQMQAAPSLRLRQATQEHFDRWGGRQLRIDPNMTDGLERQRQAGGRWELRSDGTLRHRALNSTVDGLVLTQQVSAETIEAFKREAVWLGHAGAIELPAHVRRQQVTWLRRHAPAESAGFSDEVLERRVVDHYRRVGETQGAVLDQLVRTLGSVPTAVAFKAQSPLAGPMALQGVIELKGGLSQRRALELLGSTPGLEVLRRSSSSVTIRLEAHEVTVSLFTDVAAPRVLFQSTPMVTDVGRSSGQDA